VPHLCRFNTQICTNIRILGTFCKINLYYNFKSGADYIVVGRPIKNAENRYQAANDIQKIIRSVFESV